MDNTSLSPYRRRLPVVPDSPAPIKAVCAWCKHRGVRNRDGFFLTTQLFLQTQLCRMNPIRAREASIHPTYGYQKETWVYRFVSYKNEDGQCPDFSPSLLTRLCRVFGKRAF